MIRLKFPRVWLAAAVLSSLCAPLDINVMSAAYAQQAVTSPAVEARAVPARTIPVPVTVSPQMQRVISRPIDPGFSEVPSNADEWKERVDKAARGSIAGLPALRDALGVTVQATMLGGVKAYIVTPKVIAPNNRQRVLLHLHGGYRVFNPGEAGTREAILMASLGGFKVISVDYRMPPDFPFPAALDDALAAYRALLDTTPARQIGVFGTSAGGSLTLTMLLRAKQEGLQMPGAIAPGTPTVDLNKTGDSLFTNEMVDNSLVSYDGLVRASVLLYANGHDLTDPFISPIHGDVRGFPPAILTSGTRDLYLSNTVRMHRKLRAAGVEAVLQLWEGQSHAQYLSDFNAPEVREYHAEVTRFFDMYLAR